MQCHSAMQYWVGTDETWVYFSNNSSWISLSISSNPSKRLGHNMDYNTESDAIILFGGVSYKGGTRNDETWSFRGQNQQSESSSSTSTTTATTSTLGTTSQTSTSETTITPSTTSFSEITGIFLAMVTLGIIFRRRRKK